MNLKKITLLMLATLLLITPLVGCNSKDDSASTPANETSTTGNQASNTLVVATAFPEALVRDQILNKFIVKYPEIDVQVVDFSAKLMKMQQEMLNPSSNDEGKETPSFVKMYEEAITGNPTPDIILLNGDIISQLVSKDLLMPLDPLMEKNKFDQNRYYPNVLQQLKDMGNGSIYGVVTGFNTQALFYNKGLFEKAGIEPPHDDMTWEQIQELAIQLTNLEGEKPIYGFDFSRADGIGNPFSFLLDYARPYDISFIDPVGQKIVMDTETWKQIWQDVVDMFHEGSIPPTKDMKDLDLAAAQQDPMSMFPGFYKGEVAMATGYAMEAQILNMLKEQAGNGVFEELKDLEFDVVTYPTHTSIPNVGSAVISTNMYAIPQGASNVDNAWRFLEFITSPEYLQHNKDLFDPLPAFQDQQLKTDNINYDAFYRLDSAPYQKTFDELPTIFEIYEAGGEELNKAIRHEITVDEAIANFQKRAQPLLEEGFAQLEKAE